MDAKLSHAQTTDSAARNSITEAISSAGNSILSPTPSASEGLAQPLESATQPLPDPVVAAANREAVKQSALELLRLADNDGQRRIYDRAKRLPAGSEAFAKEMSAEVALGEKRADTASALIARILEKHGVNLRYMEEIALASIAVTYIGGFVIVLRKLKQMEGEQTAVSISRRGAGATEGS